MNEQTTAQSAGLAAGRTSEGPLPEESVSHSIAREVPDWLRGTPEIYSGYTLQVEFNSCGEEIVDLTREEYIALKRHLAGMRGYPTSEISPERETGEHAERVRALVGKLAGKHAGIP